MTPIDTGLPPGTPILTPQGEVPVETLGVGDIIICVGQGAAPFRPLAALRRTRFAAPAVLIRAGALADGAPQEDLVLGAGHGVLLGGVLVAAGALVDGIGIRFEPGVMAVECLQIVLDGHGVVLAAGTAVESALPTPDAPPCAPRGEADGPLRALLGWRAEEMEWCAATLPQAAPVVGTYRARLAASPLSVLDPPAPLAPGRR